MPLTPEDVSNKRFTPVRLREGYDMGEVDQFLDEVESELERLVTENDDLKSKLAAAQNGEPPAPTQAEKAAGPEAEKTSESETVVGPEAAPAARTAPMQTIHVTTSAEVSSAATRLLELATHNADQVLDEAKADAEKIVGEARGEAERLEAESTSRTDRLEEDARGRAQMLDSETDAKRREIFGDLEKEKAQLDQDVEGLRAFEREYRSRLRSYFSEQLEALDGHGDGGDLGGPDAHDSPQGPKRLKSILGDEGAEDGTDAPAEQHDAQHDDQPAEHHEGEGQESADHRE